MSGKYEHRGVAYTVMLLRPRRWRWEIKPPASVRGMHEVTGEVEGDADEAVKAARSAIERQTAPFTH